MRFSLGSRRCDVLPITDAPVGGHVLGVGEITE
jgi:hypothetical protein